ncbi:MAG: hypothetical protein ACK55I_31840, partial [bacterium]
MIHPPWVPCGVAKTMGNWNGERYLQLPESGIQPRLFSTCPGPGGEPWQKQGGLKSQQNGGRRAAAAA